MTNKSVMTFLHVNKYLRTIPAHEAFHFNILLESIVRKVVKKAQSSILLFYNENFKNYRIKIYLIYISLWHTLIILLN